MIAAMGAPPKRSPTSAYRLGRMRPASNKHGAADGSMSMSVSSPTSNGGGSSAFTFEDFAPDKIGERPARSAGGPGVMGGMDAMMRSSGSESVTSVNSGMTYNPGLTPRAKALMQINADFKAGRISKEEKHQQKQRVSAPPNPLAPCASLASLALRSYLRLFRDHISPGHTSFPACLLCPLLLSAAHTCLDCPPLSLRHKRLTVPLLRWQILHQSQK